MPKPRLDRNNAIFFLLPALILIIAFYILPLIVTAWVSFTPLRNWRVSLLTEFIGLKNYENLFHFVAKHPLGGLVVKTTIVFVAFTLIVNVLGGLLLAIMTYIIEERVSLSFRLLWLLPRMTPLAVFGLIWYYFFYGSPEGTLNAFLLRLGLIDNPHFWGTEPQFLPWSAWSIIVFVNGIVGVSYGLIIFYSAFKNIPPELIVAARVDGASTWQIVRHILVPMTRWHLVFVTVWQLLSLVTSYTHLFVLVDWRIVDEWYGTTWALFVFNEAFGAVKNQGLAAAAAVILVIIGSLLGLLTLRIMRFGKITPQPRGDI
ncbi:MAG: sugar ABC transporter permease [Desulfurococcales archaeon]|nr:sugar ABC transporter permease [Desulfurococcales archaeon]